MNYKQVIYKIVSFDKNTYTFTLKPLLNHPEYYNHIEDYSGEFSLFIDSEVDMQVIDIIIYLIR